MGTVEAMAGDDHDGDRPSHASRVRAQDSVSPTELFTFYKALSFPDKTHHRDGQESGFIMDELELKALDAGFMAGLRHYEYQSRLPTLNELATFYELPEVQKAHAVVLGDHKNGYAALSIAVSYRDWAKPLVEKIREEKESALAL